LVNNQNFLGHYLIGIKFEQNHNLASPKAFDSCGYGETGPSSKAESTENLNE